MFHLRPTRSKNFQSRNLLLKHRRRTTWYGWYSVTDASITRCFASPRNNLSLSGGFHQGLSSRKIRAKLSPEVTVTKEACVASLRPSPILLPYLEHVGRRRRPVRQIASSIFNKAPKGPGGFVECRYKVNFDVGQVKQHRGVHQREGGEGVVERKVGTRKNEEDETKTKRTRWEKDRMNPFFVSL